MAPVPSTRAITILPAMRATACRRARLLAEQGTRDQIPPLPLGRGADGLHADARTDPVGLGPCRGRLTTGGRAHLPAQVCAVVLVTDLTQYGSTARFTRWDFCGPSTRFTTPSRRWTGWQAHGCTWST